MGASGKVGRLILRHWDQAPPQGVELVPVYRTDRAERGLVWVSGSPAPKVAGPTAIVALWGVTPVGGEDLSLNVDLARHAVALGETLGAECVVHLSSAAVYRPGPNPLTEDAADPQTDYGRAKRAMEHAVLHRDAAARQVILRVGNVAGADSLFRSIASGGEIAMDRFSDGSGPSRSYVSPPHLAQICEAAIREPVSGVFNASAPRATAMAEIAQAAGRRIRFVDAPDGAAPLVAMDTARLSEFCPLPPQAADPAYLAGFAEDPVWS
nr:NAD-dependent epimerase/dehydratase family protein [Thalassococcus arenae]